MKPKFAFALVTLAGLGFAGTASAEIDVQGLVDQLTANGYQVRETHMVQNQVRVEALYGTQRVEMVYDNTTGALLSQETSRSGTQDRVHDGTDGSHDDDASDDSGSDDSGSDDSDDSCSDDSGSDDSDHGGNDDSGSDDSGSDDSGSDDSGSDDSGHGSDDT